MGIITHRLKKSNGWEPGICALPAFLDAHSPAVFAGLTPRLARFYGKGKNRPMAPLFLRPFIYLDFFKKKLLDDSFPAC